MEIFMELYKALCEISGEGNVLKDEPMKMHTTFRIGGPADYFIQPSKIDPPDRCCVPGVLYPILYYGKRE
jgi:hypothetical protein